MVVVVTVGVVLLGEIVDAATLRLVVTNLADGAVIGGFIVVVIAIVGLFVCVTARGVVVVGL